jgi:ribose transport system permease protein
LLSWRWPLILLEIGSNEQMNPPISNPLGLSAEAAQLFQRLIVLSVLCGCLAFSTENFASLSNLVNILRQASLLSLMAAGLTIVILTGGLDLSIGATVGLAACLAGAVIKATGSVTLGLIVALGSGLFVGVINGLLVTTMRIPSFVATYGMLWFLHGVTFTFMGGETIHGFPPNFRFIGNGFLFGIPIPVYLMSMVLVLGACLLRYTTFGHEIYTIGSNHEAARLSGVPVRRRLIGAYMVSGLMAGLAGVVFLARLNSAEGDIGDSLTLPAIAAVLIGGASLFGGVGTLTGTVIGAILLTVVLNGMNLLGINANWQPLVTGSIILLAVGLDTLLRRRT